MSEAPDIKAAIARAKDGLAIYRGARLLGFIVTRRDGFDAIAASGDALGRYTSERAAAIALLETEQNG